MNWSHKTLGITKSCVLLLTVSMHVAAAEPAKTEGSQQEQNDRMIRMFVRSFFLDLCDDADKEELKQFGKKALDQAIEELKTDLHGTHPVSAEKFLDYMEGYTSGGISSFWSLQDMGVSNGKAYLEVVCHLKSRIGYVAKVTTDAAGLTDETVKEIRKKRVDMRGMLDAKVFKGAESRIELLALRNKVRLELASVDFGKEQTHVFRLENLPKGSLTIGFSLRDLPPLLAENDGSKEFNLAEVHLSVEDTQGKKVLEANSPLSAWTWSGSMHGTGRHVYLSRRFRTNGGESQSTSKSGEAYILTLKIDPLPNSKVVTPAKLVITRD
jgi:hypothetical protein